MTVDPQERSTWVSGVRSAMRAANQLPGKGPTDVDDAPCTCTLIKNPIMMRKIISRQTGHIEISSFKFI